jgi:fructosamine-3-kinase
MKFDLEAIKKQCGLDQTPIFKNQLSGGDINEVFLIDVNGQKWVVKKNESDRFPKMLEQESRALNYMAENTTAFYSKPIKTFTEGKYQYLLLEYVQKAENTSIGQQNLGIELAKQHKVSNNEFGWKEDNYIGSLHQSNKYKETWAEFYAVQRILAQIRTAFDQGIVDNSFIKKTERYCAKLEEIFPKEKPSLLHGDLWGGNYFIADNNIPFLYDPAVYFGHREMDISMTMLFGGFTNEFYKAYDQAYALEKGWEWRVPHGQLYPNLVHLNLFGRAYLGAVSNVIDKF